MKILLIDPPYERLIGFRSEWFPVGVASIGGYLEKFGHDVKVFGGEHGDDTEFKSIVSYGKNFNKYRAEIESDRHPVWKEARDLVRSFKPAVVGMSVLTPKVPSALKIARICKEIDPAIKIVLGGHHPTICADEMLSDSNVDFVLRGEGEVIFRDLVAALENNTTFEIIPALSYRKNGKTINNEGHKSVEHLDEIPYPARHKLVNVESYTPTQLSMIMTSRGCPYKCSFCATQNMWGRSVRWRSIENVIGEIRQLRDEYGVKHLMIMDDSFTVNKKYVEDFCNALIESKMGVTWACLTRINLINDAMLTKMKKAGCIKMDVGIESGNQRVLKMIDKEIKVDQIRKAAKLLHRNKLYWSGFFMMGMPTETESEIMDTLNLIKEIKPNWANISIFTPYPGTALFGLAKEKGMVEEPVDYTMYSHQNPQKFSDAIPAERFSELATTVLGEVHKYNSSYRNLFRRALSRKYHQNPVLFLHDLKKVVSWLRN